MASSARYAHTKIQQLRPTSKYVRETIKNIYKKFFETRKIAVEKFLKPEKKRGGMMVIFTNIGCFG